LSDNPIFGLNVVNENKNIAAIAIFIILSRISKNIVFEFASKKYIHQKLGCKDTKIFNTIYKEGKK